MSVLAGVCVGKRGESRVARKSRRLTRFLNSELNIWILPGAASLSLTAHKRVHYPTAFFIFRAVRQTRAGGATTSGVPQPLHRVTLIPINLPRGVFRSVEGGGETYEVFFACSNDLTL
jgi:hypothetical protein